MPRLDPIPEFDLAAELSWARMGVPGEMLPISLIEGDYLYKEDNGYRLWGSTCMSQDGYSGRIYLALRNGRPSRTSLVHELVHVELKRNTGDADSAHEWNGWDDRVDEINDYLEDQGL